MTADIYFLLFGLVLVGFYETGSCYIGLNEFKVKESSSFCVPGIAGMYHYTQLDMCFSSSLLCFLFFTLNIHIHSTGFHKDNLFTCTIHFTHVPFCISSLFSTPTFHSFFLQCLSSALISDILLGVYTIWIQMWKKTWNWSSDFFCLLSLAVSISHNIMSSFCVLYIFSSVHRPFSMKDKY